MTIQQIKQKMIEEFDEKFSKWEGGSYSYAAILNNERKRMINFFLFKFDEVEKAVREETIKTIEEKLKRIVMHHFEGKPYYEVKDVLEVLDNLK